MSNRKAVERISEPCPVGPIFVDDLSCIASFGAVAHLIFTARQSVIFDDGPEAITERVVQARLIIPIDQLQTVGRRVLAGRVELSTGVDDRGAPVELH